MAQIANPYGAIVAPVLEVVLPRMRSEMAAIMLLAIGKQESNWEHRQQIRGPARSFMQFERGGIRGVLEHWASRTYATALCQLRDVAPTVQAVYDAMQTDDIIGIGFGRFLLWTDPKPLPKKGDVGGAWDLYLRCWRPGKPRRDAWDRCYEWAVGQFD